MWPGIESRWCHLIGIYLFWQFRWVFLGNSLEFRGSSTFHHFLHFILHFLQLFDLRRRLVMVWPCDHVERPRTVRPSRLLGLWWIVKRVASLVWIHKRIIKVALCSFVLHTFAFLVSSIAAPQTAPIFSLFPTAHWAQLSPWLPLECSLLLPTMCYTRIDSWTEALLSWSRWRTFCEYTLIAGAIHLWKQHTMC